MLLSIYTCDWQLDNLKNRAKIQIALAFHPVSFILRHPVENWNDGLANHEQMWYGKIMPLFIGLLFNLGTTVLSLTYLNSFAFIAIFFAFCTNLVSRLFLNEDRRFAVLISVIGAFIPSRWLEFGLVNWTGAKVRDLYFLKALPLGCSKLILGNSLISIPVRHWTQTSFWRLFYYIKSKSSIENRKISLNKVLAQGQGGDNYNTFSILALALIFQKLYLKPQFSQ